MLQPNQIYGPPAPRNPFQPVQGNAVSGSNENPSGGPASPPDVMAAMQAMMQQGQQGAQLRSHGQHEFLFPEASRHLGIGGDEINTAGQDGFGMQADPSRAAGSWHGAHSWETPPPDMAARAVSQQQNALTPSHVGAPQGVPSQAAPSNPWEGAFTGNQSNLPLIGPQPTYGPGSGMNGQPISLPGNLAKPPPGYKGPAPQTYGPSPSPGAPGFVPSRF